MKIMWMKIEKKSGKRILASVLGICMIMQIFGWNLLSLRSYAEDRGMLKKNISVTEEELMKAVKKMSDSNADEVLKDSVLPYTKMQNEAIRPYLEELLYDSVMVKQQKLGDKCSAIVAVKAVNDDSNKGAFDYSRILMIGLNGNDDRDCEFTLKITGAENLEMEAVEVVTYHKNEVIASDSDATASDSDSTPTNPDAVETDSNSIGKVYDFIPDGGKELDQEAVENLVEKKKENKPALLSLFTADQTLDEGSGENAPQEKVFPKMTVPSREFAVAKAESVRMPVQTDGKIASVNVYADETTVNSGVLNAIYVNADYSVVDQNAAVEKVYFTVQFSLDTESKMDEESLRKLITGPESEGKEIEPGSEEEEDLEKIKALLLNSGSEDYRESAESSWKVIRIETDRYFYCEDTMLAVLDLQSKESQFGSSISGLPFRFKFQNGITPDNTKLTASPGILNWEELEEQYEEANGTSARGMIKVGDPAVVTSKAKFGWKQVTLSQTINKDTGLGNLASGEGGPAGEYYYTISTGHDYGQDKTQGVLYTKAYTIYDEMLFENFYIDVTGYNVIDNPRRAGELVFEKAGTGNPKFIGLALPKSEMKAGSAEPVYENDDVNSNKIIGLRIQYTVENDTLDSDSPADIDFLNDTNGNYIRIWFNIGGIRKEGMLRFTDSSPDSAGKVLPKVTNEVYYDAYSISSSEADYEPVKVKNQAVDTDNSTYHHSFAEVEARATQKYTIVKKAYTDESLSQEAVEEHQVFSPGSEIYYKITVANQGYTYHTFKVTDAVPEGLNFDSVELIKMTVGQGQPLTGNDLPAVAANDGKKITWGEILIPSGQTAELVVKAKIQPTEYFDNAKNNTSLTNTAIWYPAESDTELGRSSVSTFIASGALTKGQLEFSKILNSNVTGAVIGTSVTYKLAAYTNEKAPAGSHWITMTDNWPSLLTLTMVWNLPERSLTVLRDADGNEIGRYAGGGSAQLPGSFKKDGRTITASDVSRIAKVDVSIFADRQEKSVFLTGKVNEGGTVKNDATVSGGGSGSEGSGSGDGSGEIGGSTARPFTALALALEKKSYYIPASQSGSITEALCRKTPATTGITFNADDVVCYEIKVTNTNTKKGQDLTIEPTIEDDLTKIVDSNGIPMTENPDFVSADLSGKKGSVFYRKGNSGDWTGIQTPGDGKLHLELTGDKALAAGETGTILIFMTVPDSAVGSSTKTYTNKAVASVIVGDRHEIPASATISTLKVEKQEASIEKEVLAVGSRLETKGNDICLAGARWNQKWISNGEGKGFKEELETLTAGKGDYVLYRVKLNNESDSPLKIYEIEDWLPEGMEFERFYTFSPDQNKKATWLLPGTEDTLNLGNGKSAITMPSNTTVNLYYEDAKDSTMGSGLGGYVSLSNGSMGVNNKDGWFRIRLYQTKSVNPSSSEVLSIKPDSTLVFGVIAKVTGTFPAETPLINKAGFIVGNNIDNIAQAEDFDSLTGMMDKWGSPAAIGNRTYNSDKYKILTDTADVETVDYTPGIEKTLAQYRIANDWLDYDAGNPPVYFTPTDWMRWDIILENGLNAFSTSGPVEEYTVYDTLPRGLAFNEDDMAGGNVMVTASNETVPLPKPEITGGNEEPYVLKWTVKKLENGSYQVAGDTVVTTNKNLAIPELSSVRIRVGTCAEGDSARYGTYVNRADLIIGVQYPYSQYCDGEKGQIEEKDSIYATAAVNIYGSGRTEAWKEIDGTFDGDMETKSGRAADNVVLSDADGIVNYRLNVENPTKKALRNLVIVDRLPAQGDNGVINNTKRQSDFDVKFTGKADLNVSIVDKAGETVETLQSGEYQAYYGKWTDLVTKEGAARNAALPDSQWYAGKEEVLNSWNASPDEADTIRIEITDPAILDRIMNGMRVTVGFKGQIPDSETIQNLEEAIAWNTFGYAYEMETAKGQLITVEPAKVGVKVPKAKLHVSKTVDSPITDDFNADFIFLLEEKHGDSWTAAGGLNYTVGENTFSTSSETGTEGQFTLKHGERADMTVFANREYRVTELSTNGFAVKTTGFTTTPSGAVETDYDGKNPPVILTSADKSYFCTFTNVKNSLILPATGGPGTMGFHRAGILMMAGALLSMAGLCMTERRRRRMRMQ